MKVRPQDVPFEFKKAKDKNNLLLDDNILKVDKEIKLLPLLLNSSQMYGDALLYWELEDSVSLKGIYYAITFRGIQEIVYKPLPKSSCCFYRTLEGPSFIRYVAHTEDSLLFGALFNGSTDNPIQFKIEGRLSLADASSTIQVTVTPNTSEYIIKPLGYDLSGCATYNPEGRRTK